MSFSEIMPCKVKKVLKHTVLSLAARMPAPVPRRMVRFLYGHHMEEHDAPAFRRSLRILRNNFEFVTMREAIGFVRSAELPDGRFATFSYDDGFRDNYDYIAPILDEQGARACFFVSTNFIECDEQYRRWFLENRVHEALSKRPMTWEMLRTLTKAGFEVGAHTADHLNLAEVDCAEGTRQILMAKDTIESRLEIPCDYFAWPYGHTKALLPALLPLLRRNLRRCSPPLVPAHCAVSRPSPSRAPRSIESTSSLRGPSVTCDIFH